MLRTTFDIIADLLFGEPFGALQDMSTHKYIKLSFKNLSMFRFAYVTYYWPIVKYCSNLIIDQSIMAARKEFYQWVGSQTQKRIESGTDRVDFMSEILKHNGEKGAELSRQEITNNSVVMITAGSETTATLLSGVTYCLLKNPDVMQKLKDEVRGKWKHYDDITLEQVNNTPYLIAVLQEALRFFPPVPTGFERQVGQGGEMVSGHFLPEGTAVCVSQWPLGHSERNFRDANSFIPERWMGDAKFADDKRSGLQPFSFGPRNCLGKVRHLTDRLRLRFSIKLRADNILQNLAYAEMRIILAKMIWSFDMELDPKSASWIDDCKVLTLWDKPELAVHVKEAVRA